MAHAKQRTPKEDEFTRMHARAARRHRRRTDADEKATHRSEARGLRRQGDIGIIEAERPRVDNPRGRRAEPTRFDAMPIAGHERLPGYDTPATMPDELRQDSEREINQLARTSHKPPAGPDAMRIEADEAHDLQQSSEDAVADAAEDASEKASDEAAFDEHVASTDLPRPSRSEDDEDKEF